MVSEVRLSRSRDHSWGSVLNELDWGSVLNELSWSSVLNELSWGSELSLCWSSRMSGFQIEATIVLASTEILLRSGEPMLGSLELMFTKNATLLLCLLFGGVHDGQSDNTQENLQMTRNEYYLFCSASKQFNSANVNMKFSDHRIETYQTIHFC